MKSAKVTRNYSCEMNVDVNVNNNNFCLHNVVERKYNVAEN